MIAAVYNMLIDQGATFSRVLTYKDDAGSAVNLTGYTARMQVRDTYDAAGVALNLTTENGGITLGGTAGTITLAAAATATAAIEAKPYVYDLELVSGSVVSRLIQGTFNVRPEVTR